MVVGYQAPSPPACENARQPQRDDPRLSSPAVEEGLHGGMIANENPLTDSSSAVLDGNRIPPHTLPHRDATSPDDAGCCHLPETVTGLVGWLW